MRVSVLKVHVWSATLCIASALFVAGVPGHAAVAAQRSGGTTAAPKAPPPAQAPTKAPPPAPVPPMQIVVAGVRVIGPGLGANGSELQAFNDHAGTTVALAIQAPSGSGIVDVDGHASRVEAFSDDRGQNLLEEGRVGSFPKVSEDHSIALIEVEVRGRPSTGAVAVKLQGSVAMTIASGSKATRIPNVRLEPARAMKLGTATITVKSVAPSDDSTELTLALSRTVANTLQTVRFFDAKGEALESRRTGSGYMNDAAEIEYRLKSLEKLVAVEFEVWQNVRQVKIPFALTAGLSVGADSHPIAATDAATSTRPPDRPAPAGETTSKSAPRVSPPHLAPGPNDGAASIEAVVKQMQTSAVAGKGRDLLAVIYPDDRGVFAQGVAMALTFSVLGQIGDEKAAAKAQQAVDAMFTKHKVKTPLSAEPEEIFKSTDVAAFVSDALVYLKAQTPKGQDPADGLPVPKGKPDAARIDGDSAVAKLGDRDLKFVRVDKKWFIRVTE